MNEFIYSVNNIFSTDPKTGCLGINKQEAYYIAPYQRGYKWDSKTSFDQVPQLLIDLYEAYSIKANEYYLQYITVKPDNSDSSKISFEVIDGQQRLTTLSLLFYVLEKQGYTNIAKDKILYARYDEDIFEKVINEVVNSKDEDIQTQDLYYMVHAYRCIEIFFQFFEVESVKNEFVEYIKNQVKIIVNRESIYISSEEIFSNLNDNKVPLTNAYLIKGLLLTKASRKLNIFGKSLHFKEIVDQRNIMGRTWDEINAWFNEEKVKYFFFKAKGEVDGMEQMLQLVDLGKKNNGEGYNKEIIQQFKEKLLSGGEAYLSQFKLFNHFNEAVAGADDAIRLLSEIKHIYRRFKNIYDNHEDNSLYNLLGYSLFHSEKAKYELKKIVSLSDKELKISLIDSVINSLPNNEEELRGLKYNEKNQAIHQWLLALSVFPENKNPQYRFDFHSYGNEKKSLEHVSPQNPDGEIKIDDSVVEWFCAEIEKKKGESDKERLLNQIRTNKKIDTKEIAFLYEDVADVDLIGNMALLSSGVNSSLSNYPFPIKRRILFEKSNQGYFVPKHTLDVFAKTLPAKTNHFNPDFVKWDDTDVIAHAEWMVNRYSTLIANLKQQKV